MGKTPKRRRATGRLRRGKLSTKSSYRRSMHLSHKEVGRLHLLQSKMAVCGRLSRVAAMSMYPLLLCLFLAHQNLIFSQCPNATLVLHGLLFFQQLDYWKHHDRFKQLQSLDTELHDIPLEEEENAPSVQKPRQNIRFDSWPCQQCRCSTSFRKEVLLEIYNHFNLANIPAQQGYDDGFIRVSTGHRNYLFHPEELFLFLMLKCKKGFSNKDMCDVVFGGHASRWSFGFPWILGYLDDRYTNILGHQGLERFVDQFPDFFQAVNILLCANELSVFSSLQLTHFKSSTFIRFRKGSRSPQSTIRTMGPQMSSLVLDASPSTYLVSSTAPYSVAAPTFPFCQR